jgi:hypothetical protein
MDGRTKMAYLKEAVIRRKHPKHIILAVLAITHEHCAPPSDIAGSRLRLL